MHLSKIFILVLLILISCQNSKPKEDKNKIVIPERVFFELPENANVRADFELAIKKSDYRFVGVMGYSLVVPGISNYHAKYAKSNGVKIIKGTSDSHSYKDPTGLKNVVFYDNFAKSYNELLLQYLTKKIDK